MSQEITFVLEEAHSVICSPPPPNHLLSFYNVQKIHKPFSLPMELYIPIEDTLLLSILIEQTKTHSRTHTQTHTHQSTYTKRPLHLIHNSVSFQLGSIAQ